MKAPPASFGGSLRIAWNQHKGRVAMAALASATLGLAPFYPHAHIWKQLANLGGGTLGEPLDVFDLVLHGAPWVWLLVAVSHMLVSASLLSAKRRRTS